MESYNSRLTGNGNGHYSNGHGNGNGHSTNGNGHHHPTVLDAPATMDEKLSDPDLLRRYELDFPAVNLPQIEVAITDILDAVGEDPSREGLQGTPNRVARAYDEMLSGYRVDPAKLVNNAVFEGSGEDMVIVRDAQYFSMCEHHMLPFVGHAHIAYIPNGKIIGLSKIPRIVEMFSRRLQVQERLTRQIAEFIDEVLQPLGVAVVMDGTHMCSMIRGVEDTHSGMTTSTYLGAFKEDRDLKNEFLTHIQRAGGKTFQM